MGDPESHNLISASRAPATCEKRVGVELTAVCSSMTVLVIMVHEISNCGARCRKHGRVITTLDEPRQWAHCTHLAESRRDQPRTDLRKVTADGCRSSKPSWPARCTPPPAHRWMCCSHTVYGDAEGLPQRSALTAPTPLQPLPRGHDTPRRYPPVSRRPRPPPHTPRPRCCAPGSTQVPATMRPPPLPGAHFWCARSKSLFTALRVAEEHGEKGHRRDDDALLDDAYTAECNSQVHRELEHLPTMSSITSDSTICSQPSSFVPSARRACSSPAYDLAMSIEPGSAASAACTAPSDTSTAQGSAHFVSATLEQHPPA